MFGKRKGPGRPSEPSAPLLPETARPGANLPGANPPNANPGGAPAAVARSEEHTSELQSLMRISYAVFCLKKKNTNKTTLQETDSNDAMRDEALQQLRVNRL